MNDREEEEEDLGFKEYKRKKRGSGKTASSSNPKGAGRPTREWREYQEFLEWKRLKSEGISPRGLSEIIGGFARPGEGSGEGDTRRNTPRFVGRILGILGFKEKELKEIKFTQLEEKAVQTWEYFEPHVMPWIGAGVAVASVWGLWYGCESWVRWTERGLNEEEKKDFIAFLGDSRLINIKKEDGKYNITYKVLPQFWHKTFDIVGWLVDALGKVLGEEYGVTGYIDWYREKPFNRFFQGPLVFWIRRWRQRRKEDKEE